MTADCANALESCHDHFCTLDACSTFNTPCDSADAGDGTCEYFSGSLLCEQAGQAPLDACDRRATRQEADLLCPVGYACYGSVTGDVCRQLCNPLLGADAGCAAGDGCESFVLGPDTRSSSEGFCAPVSDVGCSDQGTGVNFTFACLTPADCECPRVCAIDVGQTLGACRTPCSTSTDCAFQAEWCVGGLCRPVDCGVLLDGGSNGTPGGSCLGSNAENGTCYGPFGSGLCYRAGTSTDGCVNASTSWDSSQQCVLGSLCYPAPPPQTGVCVALCDTDAGGADCPAGYGCDQIYVDFFTSTLGECVLLGDGGCNASGRGDTQSVCDTSAHCACPFTCHDPGDGTLPYCAVPCQATADCPDPSTSCQSGICAPNACSVEDSVCDAGGAENGICQAEPFPAATLLCLQAGDAGQSCDPFGSRGNPAALCPTGQTCAEEIDGGTCAALCDPSASSACASPDVCFPRLTGISEFICTPCVDIQGFCTDSSQCCAGTCDPNSFVCL
jgi:hypothetical protein